MVTTRIFISLSFVVWLFATVGGMTVLWNHELRPGVAAEAPPRWPVDSTLERGESHSTMLVWIHPHCPCSWASIGELQRLLVHLPEPVDCQVVLSRPPQCDQEFVETDLTRAVRQIPDVRVVVDHEQQEATRFGVSTSGQVLLYGRDAELLFAGGITPGRGHAGDSVGGATLREIFRTDRSVTDSQECCVFGCELFSSAVSSSPSP